MAKIIIIDDSPIIKKMIARVVAEKGHEVVGFGKDGQEGVDLFKTHQPDVVLLDITMPNKSGVECLEEIIKMDPEAKVIMFSSVADQSSVDNCIELGAKSFIKKDVNLLDDAKKTEITEAIDLAIGA